MRKQNAPPENVDAYIARFPPATQAVLARVRSIIQRAVPGAEETIAYSMPTYKLHGRSVLHFAGWKEHYALYPSTGRFVEAFKQQLAGYRVSRGSIRFPIAEPVPAGLIARIARLRAREEAAARKAAKSPAVHSGRTVRRGSGAARPSSLSRG